MFNLILFVFSLVSFFSLFNGGHFTPILWDICEIMELTQFEPAYSAARKLLRDSTTVINKFLICFEYFIKITAYSKIFQ